MKLRSGVLLVVVACTAAAQSQSKPSRTITTADMELGECQSQVQQWKEWYDENQPIIGAILPLCDPRTGNRQQVKHFASSFAIEPQIGPQFGRRRSAVADWAKELADRIRADQVAQKQEREHFIEEQRLRRQLAPKLFAEFKAALKQRCESLNAELAQPILLFEVRPHTEAIVRRLDRANEPLTVELDAEALRIRYSCGAGRGEYLFRVNPDTTLTLETAYHIPYGLEELAEQFLGLLFKSQF